MNTADREDVASGLLASEVKRRVREGGLVVWVDADAQFTGLVDSLAAGEYAFPYPVVGFRGSYLELMIALERYGSGLHAEHVLVHLPGLNKTSVEETPVFELYKAGYVFERNLASVVREAAVGVATPDEVEAFVRTPDFALAKADRWLGDLRAKPRDHVTGMLEQIGLDDVVLRLAAGERLIGEDLPKSAPEMLEFLEKGLGLDTAWRHFRVGEDATLGPTAMATLVGGWLMAVKFVHDLKEAPVTPELKPLSKLGPLAAECRRLAGRLRDQYPDVYEQLAIELQEHLEGERTSHHAAALGSVDTFRFEEATTRAAALEALLRGDWALAESYAAARTLDACFWVKRSTLLQQTWELIRRAATTGSRLAATMAALSRATSLGEATERYASELAEIDRSHRLFEQRAHALLAPSLEDYEKLLDARTVLRKAYASLSAVSPSAVERS